MTVRSEEAAEQASSEVSAPFERVLLKLSGEALLGNRTFGIDPGTVAAIAEEVRAVHESGTELAIVVGAGNIYRGVAAAADGMDRATRSRCRMRSSGRRCRRASSRRSPSRRSPSRTSGDVRCATSRRAAS
jgi:hypothetical protein